MKPNSLSTEEAPNHTAQPLIDVPPQDQFDGGHRDSATTLQADANIATPRAWTDLPSSIAISMEYSTQNDNFNVTSPNAVNFKVETDDFGNATPAPAATDSRMLHCLALPDEVRSNSSPSQSYQHTPPALPSLEKSAEQIFFSNHKAKVAATSESTSFEPSSDCKKPSISNSASDNFLASTLVNTPTNPIAASSSDFEFVFGSGGVLHPATNNVGDFHDYFSSFDFESLNGIFGTPGGAIGANDVVQTHFHPLQHQQQPQPPVEAFPLPSYLQAHLDETYAASTLIFPKVKNNAKTRDGNVFYQVTAYRHMSGNHSAAGYAQHDKENVDPCAPLLKKSCAKYKKAKAHQPRSRPLPLRKRPLMEEDENGTTSLLVERKALIRHNMPEDGAKIICRCNKSKCLKLYCDCFRNGKVCTKECCCVGCKNTISNSGPQGIRTKTITEILHRRPDAFEKREKKVDEGCRCKKNRCLKKYCVCYNIGVECDPRKCRCINCQNRPGWKEDVDEEEEDIEVDEEINIKPPSFVEIPSMGSQLLSAASDANESPVSASSSGESNNKEFNHFIVSDQRIRHSKHVVLCTNKPQDQDSAKSLSEESNNGREYLLGLGTPSPFGDIHEV